MGRLHYQVESLAYRNFFTINKVFQKFFQFSVAVFQETDFQVGSSQVLQIPQLQYYFQIFVYDEHIEALSKLEVVKSLK